MSRRMRLEGPVQVRLSRAERRGWRAAARRERKTLSDWVRALVRGHLARSAVRAVAAEEAGCTADATS